MKQIVRFILIFSLISALACGKGEESKNSSSAPPSEAMSRSVGSADMKKSAPMPEAEKKEAADADDSQSFFASDKAENQLGKVFAPAVSAGNERLLEYNIQLAYQCSDLIQTRKELLDFISKYGYLESSSATNSTSPYMSARVHVRSAKLYEALLELDKLGTLLSEDISAIDHTEGMVWQKRKMTREKIRLSRRNNANSQIAASSKNWEAIEESIASSEDELDLAEHETWKIKDRVTWATIAVSYSLPTAPDKIEVPAYKNAFAGLLNAFLQLTYYLIWWLPFLIIGGVAVYYAGVAYQAIQKKLRK
ncbi:DUF4349 domain-containing protein [Leptospira sp. FAT2]|uniref:DUF4349 domain-containing protein n=1 Tax=Leptospira sanjuanensis TaxID=2879643 RepID=UPI001EE97650|nr:DUF4349 domain-containing protein [Leptospira sanjuanensis]MCG6192896.1 DUF4349 domain-containing protein [Leptospira sanjuanensis]